MKPSEVKEWPPALLAASRVRAGRCGVGIEGLAHADGLQLAQGVGDVLVALGEELRGEVDDGAGDALRRVRPGLPQIRSEVMKTRPRASKAKVSSDGSPASVGGAQRFLSAFNGISHHFRPRRHLMPAHDYRAVMTVRFAIWEQITGVAGVAATA